MADTPNLVTLTEQERRHARSHYLDPDADTMVESLANHNVRQDMRRIAYAIEIAIAHPDDPDCARLLAALKQIGA